MDSTMESSRVGLVQRAVALGLAVVATSFIFTSGTVAFTASAAADAAADGRVALADVRTLPGA
jgi:hypothetical protein